jgi:glutathione-independent formaldehyde dehydrogenase
MLIRSVRFTGGIGVVGGFVPADPGGTGDLAQQGKVAVEYGLHWAKGQALGSGWCPVKKYNQRLRDLIAAGKANPSWIVSHELPLEAAVEAYKHCNERSPGWTKVVLKPRSGEKLGTRHD